MHRFAPAFALVLVLAAAAAAQVSFLPPSIHTVTSGSGALALADFDGDGHLDLASSAFDGVTVLLGDGAGGTTTTVSTGFTPPVGPTRLLATSLNGDAHHDLVALAGGIIVTLLGDGAGGFVQVSAQGIAVAVYEDAIASDIDGDGDIDVVAVTTGFDLMTHGGIPSKCDAFFNDGTGVLSPPTTVGPGGTHVAGGDLDADGDVDLIIDHQAAIMPGVRRIDRIDNAGNGTFGAPQTVFTPTGFEALVAVADADCDADADVVVLDRTGAQSSTLRIYGNDGVGGLALAGQQTISGAAPSDLVLADVDGDGLHDLVLPDPSARDIAVSVNVAGAFAPPVAVDVGLVAASFDIPGQIGLGDLDEDGRLDVVTGVASSFILARNDKVTVTLNATPAPLPVLHGPAADGGVDSGAGGTFDALRVNGQTGGSAHRVDVVIGAPITFDVQPSPIAPPGFSSFAIFGRVGVPACTDVVSLPFGIGPMAFAPCPLFPGVPGHFTLTSNLFVDPCGSLIPSAAAPWSATLAGSPIALTLTFQGLLLVGPGQVRVTNGVILRIS